LREYDADDDDQLMRLAIGLQLQREAWNYSGTGAPPVPLNAYMFALLPTCNSHAPIASISLALLGRYWADHPRVHVLHHEVKPEVSSLGPRRIELHDGGPQEMASWVSAVRGFLREQTDDLFVLLLDDYGLCGPVRADLIQAGARLMQEDSSVGLFPLGWYPAARREAREGRPGIVTLRGRPILLQAAIWRRSWFLELADQMGPRTSAWGFEAAATQLAKRLSREICAVDIPEPAYLGGHLVDGFEKANWPLPYHNLMHGGSPELAHESFLHREGFAFPSRGLGDTVAKLAKSTGLAGIAKSLTGAAGTDCGCNGRRSALNRMVPYQASNARYGNS
jgi:hypothetical protein